MSRRSLRNFQPFNNGGRCVTSPRGERPPKPRPDYPLFPHANGQWAKKIRGRLHYFGAWADPDGALALYEAEKDDLHAGRHPRPTPAAATVKDVANAFLNHKQQLVDSGEVSRRTWLDNKGACDLLVSEFGPQRLVADLRPDDFARLRSRMAKLWGPVRLGNTIHRVKSVFKYAAESGLADRVPLYGADFKKPSATVLRRHRAQGGTRMMEAEQVRKLIDAAGVQQRAMILLAVNAGFGNTDVAAMPMSAVDLEGGWLDFARPKTGVSRRCPLWRETVRALGEAIAARPAPKDAADADIAFLTERGTRLVRFTEKGMRVDNITIQFTSLLKRLGMHRAGLGFYSLRHVHRTAADGARDQPAADLIMGHTDASMASRYRERIDDDRLRAVADHVRNWLFGGEGVRHDA